MYLVVIEWDGEIPPRRFYDRMHSVNLFVRTGDKEKDGPISRRARADGSVIAQEGAVLCMPESLARFVATTAVEYGARLVKFGNVGEFEDMYITTDDAKTYQRMEAVYGMRGRPPGEKVDCIVTCWECAQTHPYPEQEYEHKVVQCPKCMGIHVKSRSGTMPGFSLPEGDIFDAWARMRFAAGDFEYCDVDDIHPEAPTFDETMLESEELEAIEKMRNSADFLKSVRKLPASVALRVLDAVFAAHAHFTEKQRRENRVQTLVRLYERGVSPIEAPLLEKRGVVDILSASRCFKPEHIVDLFMAIRE